MLFNSHEFLFVFLPVTWIVYLLARRAGTRAAFAWLTLASLAFYGWWYPPYLALLAASLVGNFLLGRFVSNPAHTPRARRACLTAGIVANVMVLGYFKYAGFLVQNAGFLAGADWTWANVALPLGISFITFQKIAYLHDMSRGEIAPHGFLEYCLFVTFFPQLIAGPIVHPKELLPQFAPDDGAGEPNRSADFAVGSVLFTIGLAKKVLLADEIAAYSTPVFTAAATGSSPTLLAAWGAALAYALQLYFDFSGYSDMALGAARLFGIRLPLNFHSPYKAASIAEFWKRWHMTLSRFLRDYVYIPLGGNRCHPARRHLNLFLTMTLGGLWHGAGWTFILWGGLHGVSLSINHLWTDWNAARLRNGRTPFQLPTFAARILTLGAVLVGWVLFRADSFAAARTMFAGMVGLNGLVLPITWQRTLSPLASIVGTTNSSLFGTIAGFDGLREIAWIAGLLAIVLFAPNTQQILAIWEPALARFPGDGVAARPRWWQWKPTGGWAIAASCLAAVAVLRMTRISEFLYFQF